MCCRAKVSAICFYQKLAKAQKHVHALQQELSLTELVVTLGHPDAFEFALTHDIKCKPWCRRSTSCCVGFVFSPGNYSMCTGVVFANMRVEMVYVHLYVSVVL